MIGSQEGDTSIFTADTLMAKKPIAGEGNVTFEGKGHTFIGAYTIPSVASEIAGTNNATEKKRLIGGLNKKGVKRPDRN